MNSIISFCKRKYKVLIPIMVGLVLFVTLFFLYKEHKYENTRIKKEISVFQSFSGIRTDYTAIVTYNLKDRIVGLQSKDLKIYYDSTPIYYVDEKKVIFPEEMSVVFPLKKNGIQFKVYKYASYYNNAGGHFLSNNNDVKDASYGNFFMYDGEGLFFFPDEVYLKINNEEYKKLGAMSYVNLVSDFSLVYYDTNTDTGELIEMNNDSVVINSEYYDINVSNRYFSVFSEKTLLMHPNNLEALPKTIDK